MYGTRKIRVQKSKKRRPLHNRALKEVEKRKKEAKRELRLAKQNGLSAAEVYSLAQNFFTLLRSHSKLKKLSDDRVLIRDARKAREMCHKNFSGYAKTVLDQNSDQIAPAFSELVANEFFTTVYQSEPRNYDQPDWMPSPPPPDVEMDCSLFSVFEVTKVIRRMKSKSAPSPFDRIGYLIYKKCTGLIPAFLMPAGFSPLFLVSGSLRQ